MRDEGVNTHNCYTMSDLSDFKEPDENTEIYISKYEIKGKRGRPRIIKTEEQLKELAEKKKQIAIKHYYDNWEYKRLQQKLYVEKNLETLLEKQRIYRAKKKNEKISGDKN